MDSEKRNNSVKQDEYIGILSTKHVNLNFEKPLKGTFKKQKCGLGFETVEDDSESVVVMPLWKSPDPTMRAIYDSLFSFLEEKDLSVLLRGTYIAKLEVFAITNMSLEPDENPFSSGTRYSEGFLESVIEQLKQKTIRLSALEQPQEDAVFGKVDELMAYGKILQNTYPAWVSGAIKREMARVEAGSLSGGIVSSSDSVKHALAALRYLLYIDWEKKSFRAPSRREARETLDKLFYGLEEVKERILEIIAQINRTGELPFWGILLNGPAGTGKTSIAKALAMLVGMPVIKIDVSTLGSDPEQLSGSSRIFSNAKPGVVLEKLFGAKSCSGVLLINELDKATTKDRDGGNGTADALLTLLDGQGFYENFLEESIPTDQLFAVATCNDIEKLSAPLRDRFLVINIPAYTPEEKEVIWMNYVLPRVLERMKLKKEQLLFTREASDALIQEYALELGARDLEKYSERFANVLCGMLEEKGDDYCHTFTLGEVRKLLGPGKLVRKNFAINPGEINTIFYSQGTAQFSLVEASVAKGSGELRVMGPVADIHKDYIRVAYECVRNTFPCDLSDKDISIFVSKMIPPCLENHIGCAAYAAICSLLMNTGLEIQNIAFVGGVDLNGNLYFDNADIRPLLKALKKSGIQTLYAPLGVGEMVRAYADETDVITVVEAQSADLLITMAMTASRIV